MGIMGADTLKTTLTNPARSYLFDVLIPVPIGNGNTTTFQVKAQSSEIPERTNGVINVPYKQTAGIVFAGKLNYSHKWSCSFLEGEDKSIWNALSSWQQTIVDGVAGVGVGDPFYKTDCYLNLLRVDGTTFMSLKLKGAWVQSVGDVALSYGVESIITYNVTFAFDSIEDVS